MGSRELCFRSSTALAAPDRLTLDSAPLRSMVGAKRRVAFERRWFPLDRRLWIDAADRDEGSVRCWEAVRRGLTPASSVPADLSGSNRTPIPALDRSIPVANLGEPTLTAPRGWSPQRLFLSFFPLPYNGHLPLPSFPFRHSSSFPTTLAKWNPPRSDSFASPLRQPFWAKTPAPRPPTPPSDFPPLSYSPASLPSVSKRTSRLQSVNGDSPPSPSVAMAAACSPPRLTAASAQDIPVTPQNAGASPDHSFNTAVLDASSDEVHIARQRSRSEAQTMRKLQAAACDQYDAQELVSTSDSESNLIDSPLARFANKKQSLARSQSAAGPQGLPGASNPGKCSIYAGRRGRRRARAHCACPCFVTRCASCLYCHYSNCRKMLERC